MANSRGRTTAGTTPRTGGAGVHASAGDLGPGFPDIPRR